MTDQRGGALVTFAIALPVLMTLLALCIEAGRLFYARALLQAAADHAVLAGIQELDYEALAGGTIRLQPEAARRQTRAVFTANLDSLALQGWLPLNMSRIAVYNAAPDETTRNTWTNRLLEYPTVCLVARAHVTPVLPIASLAPGLKEKGIPVTVHADASVEPRER